MRSSSPVPSGRAAAWCGLAILSGLNLLNYLDRYVMSAVLTPLRHDLGFTQGGAGWTASAFMWGYFITAPLFGYLGDRWPRKYLMLAGVIVWSVATACSGLAQNFTQLFCIRLFVGVGEAAFVTMGPSWISDLFASARRNTALTLFYVSIPCGSAIGFTIGGWFADHSTWRHAFIFAGLPGVVLALVLLFLREPGRGEADGFPGDAPDHPKATLGEIFGLLRNCRYNLLVWGYAAQTFAMGGFAVWGASFLHEAHQMSNGHAATIFGEILAATGLVATLLGGFIANALRKRTPAGYVWLMAFSMIVAIPICFFALTVGDATLSLTGLGAAMFFLFLPTGPITSEIFEIVPVHLRASAVALCTFMIHLFGDVGSPTIVGYVSDASGALRYGVLILPVLLLVGAILWTILIRYTREPLAIEP
jgi:predicted MFS family arabinose efflux permease